jgi:hypothetical protein
MLNAPLLFSPKTRPAYTGLLGIKLFGTKALLFLYFLVVSRDSTAAIKINFCF